MNHNDEKMTYPTPKKPSPEMTIAKHLFERIAKMGKHDIPGLKVWSKAISSFNGDISLCALRPSGGIHILLADFIGGGLPAAVGALPVAEIFYGMTENGFGLSDIIEEINKKLLFVLPAEYYSTACLMELDRDRKVLTVWNGGMPDVLVLDSDSKIKHRISSTPIPLGLHEVTSADLDTTFIEVAAGDTVFWCSDGAINAENIQGLKFGQDQIEQLLIEAVFLSAITSAIKNHVQNVALVDDITLAQLDISALQKEEVSLISSSTFTSKPPAKWQVDFSLSADVLREVDIAPLLVSVLMKIQAPYEHRQRIHTVLAEMCSNALEHGVLGLPSSMKTGADGFAEYYALRSQRMAKLEDAYINISLQNVPFDVGGRLTIRIEDSGLGFDHQQHISDLAKNKAFSGRGETLIRQLCSDYYYSGAGNCAHAVYLWTAS